MKLRDPKDTSGKVLRIPSFIHAKGWQLHVKGYAQFTGRKRSIKRGAFAHREVIAFLLKKPIPEGFHVHHQNFDKLDCCPYNLILMPAEFNPAHSWRCPYTGRYLSPAEYEQRYGRQEPSWVGTGNSIVDELNTRWMNPDA